MQTQAQWFIGLMSGTSLDGIDGVLVDFADTHCRIAQHASVALNACLRADLLALNRAGGPNELHRAALAGNALARASADVVAALLKKAGLLAQQVHAVGTHGQTVRHCPGAFDGTGYTLQLNNPALLAECCGITVVADFRSRDVAAGGQGAPLVPAFHRHLFAQHGRTVGVLNVGGIANVSLLRADNSTQGWDCGPGNMLLDEWCQRHTGAAFDKGGEWGRGGQVSSALLHALLDDVFFQQLPPKSTGRDLFNASWLEPRLHAHAADCTPQDVQATLTELTARACAQDFIRHAPEGNLLIVCGGGALNHFLMERLQARLPAVRVEPSGQHGIAPQQVEAAAFAWLARQCLQGQSANSPQVTGARGPRILGAIYQA